MCWARWEESWVLSCSERRRRSARELMGNHSFWLNLFVERLFIGIFLFPYLSRRPVRRSENSPRIKSFFNIVSLSLRSGKGLRRLWTLKFLLSLCLRFASQFFLVFPFFLVSLPLRIVYNHAHTIKIPVYKAFLLLFLSFFFSPKGKWKTFPSLRIFVGVWNLSLKWKFFPSPRYFRCESERAN